VGSRLRSPAARQVNGEGSLRGVLVNARTRDRARGDRDGARNAARKCHSANFGARIRRIAAFAREPDVVGKRIRVSLISRELLSESAEIGKRREWDSSAFAKATAGSHRVGDAITPKRALNLGAREGGWRREWDSNSWRLARYCLLAELRMAADLSACPRLRPTTT
jgi:hypothetical protein